MPDDKPLTFSIDECEEAFVRDFCPYRGSPDPLVVWRAAWTSATVAAGRRITCSHETLEQLKKTHEPLRGDEPVHDQEVAGAYVRGWNGALQLAMSYAAPSQAKQSLRTENPAPNASQPMVPSPGGVVTVGATVAQPVMPEPGVLHEVADTPCPACGTVLRASPPIRLGYTREQMQAAEARCARMREALETAKRVLPDGLPGSSYAHAHAKIDAALAADKGPAT